MAAFSPTVTDLEMRRSCPHRRCSIALPDHLPRVESGIAILLLLTCRLPPRLPRPYPHRGALGSLAQRTIKGRRNYDSQTCPDARGWPDGSDAGLENRVGKKPIASLTQVDGLRSVMSQKFLAAKCPRPGASVPQNTRSWVPDVFPTFRHHLSTYRQRAM